MGGRMQHISFEALADKAMELKQAGVKWHFHMIGPACIYSDTKDGYEIMIEIEATGETITAWFKDKPIDQTHKMAQLAYGSDFLKKEKVTDKKAAASGNDDTHESFKNMMDRARACCASGKPWHNHHLPPQCRFNPNKGMHAIVFEDETGAEPLYAFYTHDPIDALAELERLFFDGFV